MRTMTLNFVSNETGEVTTVKPVKRISLVTVEEMLDKCLELEEGKYECNCYHNDPNSLVFEVVMADGTFKYYDIKAVYSIEKI